ncbi:MAG: class I mannose-6-phosphate isomerase [Bacteroidales bacterium]|nr:class I mannose-6-phosphate isomerase [Bacteroidales bacterium]
MSELYPFRFKPQYFNKIWGGNNISEIPGHRIAAGKLTGEAWLLSGVEGHESVVENGFLSGNNINELVEVYMSDLTGDPSYSKFGDEFPLLVKILDAGDWLSVQVHPNDELALKRHGSQGKSELWYIMEAARDARLVGHLRGISGKKQLTDCIRDNSVRDFLRYETVKKGDACFIPAGRVHAVGPGILLAEIQQTSDITYRIYDWDRIDAAGFKRELHTDLALDAIDYRINTDSRLEYENLKNGTANIISCPYFTTNIIHLTHPLRKNFSELDSFVVYLCMEGNAILHTPSGDAGLMQGELALIPADIDRVDILPEGETRLLEVYVMPA